MKVQVISVDTMKSAGRTARVGAPWLGLSLLLAWSILGFLGS